MRPYRKPNEKWFKKEVEFIIQKSHCRNISGSVFYQIYAAESINEDQIAVVMVTLPNLFHIFCSSIQ